MSKLVRKIQAAQLSREINETGIIHLTCGCTGRIDEQIMQLTELHGPYVLLDIAEMMINQCTHSPKGIIHFR